MCMRRHHGTLQDHRLRASPGLSLLLLTFRHDIYPGRFGLGAAVSAMRGIWSE